MEGGQNRIDVVYEWSLMLLSSIPVLRIYLSHSELPEYNILVNGNRDFGLKIFLLDNLPQIYKQNTVKYGYLDFNDSEIIIFYYLCARIQTPTSAL